MSELEHKIKTEDFLAWIMEQDREKKLNFRQNIDNGTLCGCPMVQYGREKLNLSNISASFDSIFDRKKVEFEVYNLESSICQILGQGCLLDDVIDMENYGQLQDFINEST